MAREEHRPEPLPAKLRDALERAAAELFVGREREIAELDSAMQSALGGRGRVILVAGEPGIGKTRIVEAFEARARERGARVLWGRSWEGEGAPALWLWVQITRSYVRECDAKTLASLLGIGAPYVAQVVPEVRSILPDVPAAPPLDSEQARFHLYDSFCAFFRNVAARIPVVLVLDDLHWADKSSLLLLQFVAREIVDARLLVLATYRDVEVSVGHPLGEVLPSLRRERTVDRILLRGLPEDQVRAMLERLRGGEVPETFARNLAHETGGNPFFIKEILRHLLDEGVAYREGDRWETRLDEREIRLPESVREVVGRRLSRLGDPCRNVLTLASVIGPEFGLDVLRTSSEVEEERLLELLDEAVYARVIDAAGQFGRYRFSHALIRETLYGELRTVERLRLHRRVAEALERLHGKNPEPHLAELAHHFLEAIPGADVARAIEYAMSAGDRAAGQLAHEEAELLYGRALQALELADSRDDQLRCELLLKRGDAQWNAGGFENPVTCFVEAAALAQRLGEPELLARAALGFGGPGVGLAMVKESLREANVLAKALAALEPGDSILRVRVMARMASLRHYEEEFAELARPALEMARRIGDKPALVYVLNATPWASWGPDDDVERLPLADEMIRLAEEVGDQKLAAEGHLWRAAHYLYVGDADAARRDFDAQLRFADTSRQPYHRWLAALNRGATAILDGRLDEAEKHHREACAVAAEVWGAAVEQTVINLDRGIGPVIRRLRHAERSEDIAAYETMSRAQHSRSIWRVILARTYCDARRPDDARREFERVAASDFADVPRDLMWVVTTTALAEITCFLGDLRRAAVLYDLLLPYANRYVLTGTLVCTGSVARHLGLLATTLSRFDEAEAHFLAALERNEKIRGRPWIAQTQHDYAGMLLRRGAPRDREKAEELLENALATARELGMGALESAITRTGAEARIRLRGERTQAAAPLAGAPSSFRKDGDFWTIAHERHSLRLKDSKGLQYVAELLRREGEEIHVTDLAAGGGDAIRDRGGAGEVLDAQARSEYRERLRDLEAELEEATRWSDVGRAARLQEEIDFLKDELSSAFGLGGRPRKAADSTERVRKAVASRIRDAIEKIGKEHRALALHLENAIRTGVFCSYRPDRSPEWHL